MPAIAGELSPDQVRDVIASIRDLQNDAAVARDEPGAEACLIEPRTLANIELMGATPAADAPPAPPTATGEPADPDAVAGITRTARELVAGSNAGDSMRRLALYSDDRIRMSYPEGPTPAWSACRKR